MRDLLITSYIDIDYYILSNEVDISFLLATIIMEEVKGEELSTYTDMLGEYSSFLMDGRKENLFVFKESDFGRILTSLIEKGVIFDEKFMVRKDILANALLASLLMEDTIFLDKDKREVIKLIRKGREGSSYSSDFRTYSTGNLYQYIKLGRIHNSLEELAPKLTGNEKNGLIYSEGKWCRFDIVSKQMFSLQGESAKRRKKLG